MMLKSFFDNKQFFSRNNDVHLITERNIKILNEEITGKNKMFPCIIMETKHKGFLGLNT